MKSQNVKREKTILKKYFRNNTKLFDFISYKNLKKNNIRIIKIEPIRKITNLLFFKKSYISSYCVTYEKMI